MKLRYNCAQLCLKTVLISPSGVLHAFPWRQPFPFDNTCLHHLRTSHRRAKYMCTSGNQHKTVVSLHRLQRWQYFSQKFPFVVCFEQEYLQKARSYIQNSTEASVSVEDIKGIWVSYNDDDVLFQVKESLGNFFPNIIPERVLGISNRSFRNYKASGDALPTTSNGMVCTMKNNGWNIARSMSLLNYFDAWFGFLLYFVKNRLGSKR